uniref:Uncharacterized protein n=1 Tax=Rhizophora mucronata TaxID=61149 RepID=A0A2P2PPV1_RHIMU
MTNNIDSMIIPVVFKVSKQVANHYGENNYLFTASVETNIREKHSPSNSREQNTNPKYQVARNRERHRGQKVLLVSHLTMQRQ